MVLDRKTTTVISCLPPPETKPLEGSQGTRPKASGQLTLRKGAGPTSWRFSGLGAQRGEARYESAPKDGEGGSTDSCGPENSTPNEKP